jgi:hypothetical protein
MWKKTDLTPRNGEKEENEKFTEKNGDLVSDTTVQIVLFNVEPQTEVVKIEKSDFIPTNGEKEENERLTEREGERENEMVDETVLLNVEPQTEDVNVEED